LQSQTALRPNTLNLTGEQRLVALCPEYGYLE
jgi:hypothetical protein